MSEKKKERDSFAEAIAKLTVEDVSAMMTHMMRQFSMSGLCQNPAAPVVLAELRQHRLDLPPIDTKLDGPEKYLSWSHRVKYTLERKNLEGYLTGRRQSQLRLGRDEWKSTHMQVYIWLLSSLYLFIASKVDGMEKVKDVWEKFKKELMMVWRIS